MNISKAFKKTTGLDIKEGIQKAIEGGYDIRCQFMVGDSVDTYLENEKFGKDKYKILLDPKFWEALGSGLGNKDEMRCDSQKCDTVLCEYGGYKDPKRMFDSLMECLWY